MYQWVTSLDVQIKGSESKLKRSKKSKGSKEIVNLAVGGLKGSIFVFEDVLESLTQSENHSQRPNTEPLAARKLHWHRNAVASVKWSSDGESS